VPAIPTEGAVINEYYGQNVQLVRVVDFDISFFGLVGLFVKMAMAVIPAILFLFVFAIAVILLPEAIRGAPFPR
jgi:hypothetical protein